MPGGSLGCWTEYRFKIQRQKDGDLPEAPQPVPWHGFPLNLSYLEHLTVQLYAIAGTYSDRWVRTAEGWRIEMRTQTYEWRSGNRDVVAR